MNSKKEIPVFFSADNNYVPCLTVAMKSLIENSSEKNNYKIIILNSGISEENKRELRKMETNNIRISFTNVDSKVKRIEDELKLRLRDYYSVAIYYRLFIPSIFPEYDKVIYLDSDIVVNCDIAELYNKDMGDNIIGAVKDMTINTNKDFIEYSKIAIGVEAEKYINSGMLLINVKAMRENKIEQKFLYLLTKYNLETAAPDQDYLNVLCKDKIYYLDEVWDKMPDFGDRIPVKDLKIIHYNMFRKPWHYADVPYSEEFWKYAKMTKFYDLLQDQLASYTDEQKAKDLEGVGKLVELTKKIIRQDIKFADIGAEAKLLDLETNNNAEEEGSFSSLFNWI